MVGRNDPCPCGSGKKYKKCCALREEVTSETLVEEELERILMNYYRSSWENPADMAELDRYERNWMSALSGIEDADTIESEVIDYYLFVVRRDLWKRYLVKVQNGAVRATIQPLLEVWQNPFVLLGKVLAVHGDHFTVKEILGHRTYEIDCEDGMVAQVGQIVFGVVLPDNRKVENGIQMLGGLSFISDRHGLIEEKISEVAEASGTANSHEFFVKHMLDIYKAFHDVGTAGIVDSAGSVLSPEQLEVMEILEQQLASHDLDPAIKEFIGVMGINYLLSVKPAFRKPEAVAAAIYKVAHDEDMIEATSRSQAEIAKLFNVSVGSMTKHAVACKEAMDEMVDEFNSDPGQGPTFSYWIGTDPGMTERANWEMHCRVSSMELQSMEDMQAMINSTINTTFTPKSRKQQAQAFAYEAYEADNKMERNRLAELALKSDPDNVDAVLLQAERTVVDKEAELLYLKAIRLGESMFDPSADVAWRLVTNRPYLRSLFVFGIWLIKRDRKKEALPHMEKLLSINPSDNQGVRYIAASLYIAIDELPKAKALLDKYAEDIEDDAPYLYLKSIIVSKLGRDSEYHELRKQAIWANDYVIDLLEGNEPIVPYPVHSTTITPGSKEEANYIAWLL